MPQRHLPWAAVPLEEDHSDRKEDSIRHGERRESNLSSKRRVRFKNREECLPAELFYDLWFVANLNVFTTNHEISTLYALLSYIGFFGILWLTWFQVSAFDVRLGVDSVLDRCMKALQLGVMLGLAVIGSKFDSYDPAFYINYGQALSLLLMANRFILAFQHAIVAVLPRDFSDLSKPAMILALGYLMTGATYLGISFIFPHGGSRSFRAGTAWYAIALAEAAFQSLAMRLYGGLSYTDTHIVERMGLLTLIVLGEGVIGLLEAATTVWISSTEEYYSAFISTVICTTLILFFLYQLYFDNQPHGHFGSLTGRVWSLLHFPLHVALVLTVEGAQQFVRWKVALEAAASLTNTTSTFDVVSKLFAPGDSEPGFSATENSTIYFEGQAILLADWAAAVQNSWPTGVTNTTASTIAASLDTVRNGVAVAAEDVYVGVAQVLLQTYSIVFRAYQIEPPESETEETLDGLLDTYLAFYRLFDLVLVYFFVAAGAALILLGIIIMISRNKHKRVRVREQGSMALAHLLSPSSQGTAGDDNRGEARTKHIRETTTGGAGFHSGCFTVTTSPSGATSRQKSLIEGQSTNVPDQTMQQKIHHNHAGHNEAHLTNNETLRSPPTIFRISLFFIAGIGLGLVAVTDLSLRNDGVTGQNFLESYWVLPSVCLTLFVVLTGQHIPLPRKWDRRRVKDEKVDSGN